MSEENVELLHRLVDAINADDVPPSCSLQTSR
jgi:hypothetical protein